MTRLELVIALDGICLRPEAADPLRRPRLVKRPNWRLETDAEIEARVAAAKEGN